MPQQNDSINNKNIAENLKNIDLSKPEFDQSTYNGRYNHFFNSTDPLNLLIPQKDLEVAKKVVQAQKLGKLFSPSGANELGLDRKIIDSIKTKEDLFKFKRQYDSAFHPETQELQPWWGRMSSQVPMNMTITGAMIALSHTPFLNLFWQLANQSYNAAVNYTNRSGGGSDVSNIAVAWAIASSSAVGVSALAQKSINNSKTFQKMNPTMLRAVAPFAGIVVANLINIPVMRNQEFIQGIALSSEDGEIVGHSKKFTYEAIPKVVLGRLCIAACCVIFPSAMMQGLQKIPVVRKLTTAPGTKGKVADSVATILCVGLCLWASVPAALAIFPQKVGVPVEQLPSDLKASVLKKNPDLKMVYYNKGL